MVLRFVEYDKTLSRRIPRIPISMLSFFFLVPCAACKQHSFFFFFSKHALFPRSHSLFDKSFPQCSVYVLYIYEHHWQILRGRTTINAPLLSHEWGSKRVWSSMYCERDERAVFESRIDSAWPTHKCTIAIRKAIPVECVVGREIDIIPRLIGIKLRGTTSLTAWKKVIFVNLKKKVSNRMF